MTTRNFGPTMRVNGIGYRVACAVLRLSKTTRYGMENCRLGQDTTTYARLVEYLGPAFAIQCGSRKPQTENRTMPRYPEASLPVRVMDVYITEIYHEATGTFDNNPGATSWNKLIEVMWALQFWRTRTPEQRHKTALELYDELTINGWIPALARRHHDSAGDAMSLNDLAEHPAAIANAKSWEVRRG